MPTRTLVRGFTARRSGGSITVTGTDERDQPVKATDVDTITWPKGEVLPIATTKNGNIFELSRTTGE